MPKGKNHLHSHGRTIMLLADAEDIRQRPRAVSMQVGAIRTHKLPCPAAPPHDVSAAGLVVVVVVRVQGWHQTGPMSVYGAQKMDVFATVAVLHTCTRRRYCRREHLETVCDVYHARRPETHSRSGANACRRFQHAHHSHSCAHNPIRASKLGVRGAPWRGLTRTYRETQGSELGRHPLRHAMPCHVACTAQHGSMAHLSCIM